ncbi:MAG: pentapeptide repeat-containing protein [Myxococcales bacterium]|jgi:BRCT domain type II-containing protein|nr:pentapeptide repeat-containing protein [Myxococcales bacterium]
MAKPTSRAVSKAATSPKPAKSPKPLAKPARVATPKPKRAPRTERPQPYAGKRFAFFGEFAVWPGYHRSSPAGVAARLGARIVEALDEQVDVVVFGELRGPGRAEAKKLADKLVARPGARLEVLDEATFRDRVRIDLTGKRFAFIGGFDCSPAGLEDGLLTRMVETAGGVVVADLDPTLDYLVVGNRRGPSKIALSNKADKLNEAGATIKKLDESSFLELVRVDRPSTGGELDFAGFLSQLYGSVDEGKLGRALDMLRKDRFKLYTRVDDAHLVGVVRSQSGSGSVYASWLTSEGRYGCAQPDLSECMGLQGTTCKHLLVLVCGLARTGQIPLERALAWIRSARTQEPSKNHELCAETFIQYKGAEAGEVDWRPTETIPEDYYAL